VARKVDLSTLPEVVAVQREVEAALGREGRLVLRYSGTEPLARVMIEGPEQAEIDRLAHLLADAIRTRIGAPGEGPAPVVSSASGQGNGTVSPPGPA